MASKCFSLLSDVAMIIGRVTTIGSIPVGSGWKVLNKNALIAESGLAVNTAFQAFGNAPCDSIIENLDLFEELLEAVAS